MHSNETKSLVYILILTLVGSVLAYRIVVKAYGGIITDDYETQIIRAK